MGHCGTGKVRHLIIPHLIGPLTLYFNRYKAIASRFYKGVDGVILVYDITSHESYEKIDSWVKQAKENTTKELPFILIGNKSDLVDKRDVQPEEGEKIAAELN